jgi:hypothetical protein
MLSESESPRPFSGSFGDGKFWGTVGCPRSRLSAKWVGSIGSTSWKVETTHQNALHEDVSIDCLEDVCLSCIWLQA